MVTKSDLKAAGVTNNYKPEVVGSEGLLVGESFKSSLKSLMERMCLISEYIAARHAAVGSPAIRRVEGEGGRERDGERERAAR